MKKTVAILLAVLMTLTLFACSSSSGASSASASPSAPPAAPASQAASPSATVATASPSVSAGASQTVERPKWEVGFYNPDTDYSKNPKYKVVYMVAQTSLLFDSFDKAFQKWAERYNLDYSFWCANGDNDLFLTTIHTFADQGCQGFLLDPDNTTYPAIADVMKDIGKPWMSVMGAARSAEGKLLHPSVGFDFFADGTQMAQWLIDYQKKTWPDAKPNEIGMLAIDYSTTPPLHVRVPGAKVAWDAAFPGNDKNFIIADVCGQTNPALNADAGYNTTAPVIAAHSEIKYWLVMASLDDFAMGTARALEAAKKDQNAVEIAMGGDGLVAEYDQGQESCWKAALYTVESVYAEPIVGGLYAMMTGQATPEALWPEWVNHHDGEKYAFMQIPSEIITKENYKSFLSFSDLYTGIKTYPYTWDGTQYPVRMEVPASYNAPADASPSK